MLDNLLAGHRQAVRYGDFVEGDITDSAAVAAALRRYECFAVMHFAAILDVGESVREPLRYYRNNVGGALSVLEAMVAESVKYFVFSSTCATYGEPIETPISESHPQNPINAYGETKLAVERALPHVERAYDLRWMALRYFNAAGADPDAELGEDHSPEIHLIPRTIFAATGSESPHFRAECPLPSPPPPTPPTRSVACSVPTAPANPPPLRGAPASESTRGTPSRSRCRAGRRR